MALTEPEYADPRALARAILEEDFPADVRQRLLHRLVDLADWRPNGFGGWDALEGRVRLALVDESLALYVFTPAPGLVLQYAAKFTTATPPAVIAAAVAVALRSLQ